MSFSFQMLGAKGAMSRLEELRVKVEQFNPSSPAAAAPSAEFGGTFAKLTGQITPSGANPEYAPVNPFGLGMQPNANPGLRQLARRSATDAGVDPNLFEALVAAESSFNPATRSRAGAMGLSQLMPGTAKMLGVTDPFDPVQNLRGGATYLRQMLDQFGGNERLALAAYNAGPGAVRAAGNKIPQNSETPRYVEKVLTLRENSR